MRPLFYRLQRSGSKKVNPADEIVVAGGPNGSPPFEWQRVKMDILSAAIHLLASAVYLAAVLIAACAKH